uniref:CECR2 histone acetyl-lysine reader n=1 Tax=Amphiprion percula TaxID=161767 RepID=A0A3P8RS52_AMPPE
MSQGCVVSVEEVQCWWEVPAIAHFCSLFRTAFNLPDFEIEELEKALSEQDLDFLGDLIACLLQGCYQRTDITPQAFSSYLDDIISYRWELEEGKPNPLREGPFENLPPRTQVELLHRLCDYRLDAADVFDLLKGLDADSLRVEPLGQDGNGALYWYFYGTRMYKEEPVKRKCVSSVLLAGRKRGAWSLVCDTEEQWVSLAESIKDKTSPQDRHLYRVISQNFLPEISSMIEHKVRHSPPQSPTAVHNVYCTGKNDNVKSVTDEDKRKDEELDRQVLLAEQRREEERLLQEERQREKMEKIKAVEERAKRRKMREEKAWLLSQGKDLPPELLNLEPSSPVHRTRKNKEFYEIDDDYTALYKILSLFSLIIGEQNKYTIMAESLERCFSRAILKHFPSEDGDTDEEFHISREDKERKDKKRNRGSKHLGPDSLIRATEQVQRKRNSLGGKGSTPSEEEDNKMTRPPLPPHWAKGPPHPHMNLGQHHLHERDIRGLYHPGQQLRHPAGPPGPHGPHMYAQRMAMDPRFAYPVHISRHGDPNLNRLPHNFSMQVCRTHFNHHMGPRYPMDPNQQQPPQQHPYVGPTHGPSLGPRPMGLQPGPPPEASMYPSHHRPEGHTMHPMGNRFAGPEGPPQHNYPGMRPPGMGLSNMWTGMNHQGQERHNGMRMQDPNMVNQRNFSYGGIPPPMNHKPWPEAAGYPHHPSNAQYQMSAAASSQGPMSLHPPVPHPDSSGRARLASMLESPEMLALQQLSASSGPPAGQHIGNFRQPGPPSGIGSIPAHPSQQPPPALEVQLLRPARDKGPDSQPSPQTDSYPKGRPDLLLHHFTSRLISQNMAVAVSSHLSTSNPTSTDPPQHTPNSPQQNAPSPTLPPQNASPLHVTASQSSTQQISENNLKQMQKAQSEHHISPQCPTQNSPMHGTPHGATQGSQSEPPQPAPLTSLPPSHPAPLLPSQPSPADHGDQRPSEPTSRPDSEGTAVSPQHTVVTSGQPNIIYKHQAFSPNHHQTQLVGNNLGMQSQRGPPQGHNPAVPPHSQGQVNGAMGPYGMGNPPHPHYNQTNMSRPMPPTAHHPYHNQGINALHNPAPHPNYHQQGGSYSYHIPGQQHPQSYYPQGSYPPEEWHRSHYQPQQPMPPNAYLPVASARANGPSKESSLSPLGSEGSSGTGLVSPGPVHDVGPHPGGTEEGKCESREQAGGGSPAKPAHSESTEQPDSPKEILDLDSHNAAARRRSTQPHMTSGFMYDPRALHPGMQQGGVPPPHMMPQGCGNRPPYPSQAYPDPGRYATQRPHPHLMEALQRPQQLPYSPGQTRMAMYRHPRPGGHFQGMMIQQRGLPPERFLHPGQQMMAAPGGPGSKPGL